MENLDTIKNILATYNIDNEILALELAILVAKAERAQIEKDFAV